MAASRTLHRLTFDCNSACLFCGQGQLDTPLTFERQQLEALRAQGHDALSFVGGEPTLDPALVERVALARELGFVNIGIQTNAQAFATDAGLLERLANAGLTDLHLSIHAPTAASHDYHTGRPGSFEASLAVIRDTTRQGLTAVVATVVTRSNYRDLLNMPALLKRHGVAGWLVEFVRPYGRAGDNFARVIPRFGMALPWVLHALEQARRHALSAWIRGAPLCGLGPFAALAVPDAPQTHPRNYVEACEGCPSRPRCAGVDPAYLEVFDASELRPVAAREPARFDAGRQRLIAMFVGPGELVHAAPTLYSDDARAARAEAGNKHRLPVLSNSPE